MELRTLGLLYDPFAPLQAEERDESKLILVGEHDKIYKTLLSTIGERIKSGTSHGWIIIGDWGTGKTAILRKVYFELKKDKSILCNYVRLPVGTTLRRLLIAISESHCSEFLKEKLDELRKLKSVSDEDLPDESRLYLNTIELISENLKQEDVRGYVLLLDQIENLLDTEENIELIARYLRDMLRDVKKESGKPIFLVLSVLTRAYSKLQQYSTMLRDYPPRPLTGQLSLNECKELFKRLLAIARLKEASKAVMSNPYYPFTDDGIEEIYYKTGGRPGLLYQFATTCLMEAASIGVDRINGEFVRRTFMPVEPSWVDALSKPPLPISECLERILEYAQENGIILTYLNVRNFKVEDSQFRSILNIDDDKLRKLQDIKNSTGLIDFIVVYSEGEEIYMSIIKISEKILRADTARKLERLLKIAEPSIEDRILQPRNVKIIGLTGGLVTKNARNILRALRVSKGYEVWIRVIDFSQPHRYGRIRHIADRLEHLLDTYGDYSLIPESLQQDINVEVERILCDLKIK